LHTSCWRPKLFEVACHAFKFKKIANTSLFDPTSSLNIGYVGLKKGENQWESEDIRGKHGKPKVLCANLGFMV
jgi:hypothetical protein